MIGVSPDSVRKHANFKAKYGLGTTVTETDTEGRDVTVRVLREFAAPRAHDGN